MYGDIVETVLVIESDNKQLDLCFDKFNQFWVVITNWQTERMSIHKRVSYASIDRIVALWKNSQ